MQYISSNNKHYSRFSHDDTAAMLESSNNETAPMLECQNPILRELNSIVMQTFSFAFVEKHRC